MYIALCNNGECFSDVLVQTKSYLMQIKIHLYKKEYGEESSQMDANIMNQSEKLMRVIHKVA